MEKNNKQIFFLILIITSVILLGCAQEYCLTLEGNYNKWGVEGGLTYCSQPNSDGTAKFVDENGKESYLVPAETLEEVVQKLDGKTEAKAITQPADGNPFQDLCDKLRE